ncbi:MAG: ATP-binding protein [Opitutales bacterium]
MKEVVFTKPPYMNASEQRIADMHTVLNILSVVLGEVCLNEPRHEELKDAFHRLESNLRSIATAIKENGELSGLIARMRESEADVLAFMRSALAAATRAQARAEIEESMGNLESVYCVLKLRLNELDMRAEDPDLWVQIDSGDFRKQFEDVFDAIAKNSRGRFGIHFDSEQKGPQDYCIDLKIDANAMGGWLWMPLRMLDVLRDLTANARKYTEPGGRVSLAFYQDEHKMAAVIEDSGCGIPEDELEGVAEFGYRASNVRHRSTRGGGFGLTKAIWLVTSWGGRISINSGLDEGSVIRIDLPNLKLPADPMIWVE